MACRAIAACFLALLTGGCIFGKLKDDLAILNAAVSIRGHVSGEASGDYVVIAFEDDNEDFEFQHEERIGWHGAPTLLRLAPGEQVADVNIVLRPPSKARGVLPEIYAPDVPVLRMELDTTQLGEKVRYGFKSLFVVAHSMGGLLSRGFINNYAATGETDSIELLITLSTPWDGHSSAQTGVNRAPAVIPVWYDLVPGSPYIESLFDTAPPDCMRFLLLFS